MHRWCSRKLGIGILPTARRTRHWKGWRAALFRQTVERVGVHHGGRHSKMQVKLTDFGIGQVVSEEALAGLTKLGFTQTMMSPGSSAQTGTQM